MLRVCTPTLKPMKSNCCQTLMENLSPESSRLSPVLVALILMIAAASVDAEIRMPALQPNMPIIINAESSEFDYTNNRLVFHGLRLDQGTLGVEADLAETDKLDFENGMWNFTGNVIVEADNAVLYCDKARLWFVNHQLISAELTGEPARFEQTAGESEQVNSGEANSIIYKLTVGTLQLTDDARFSDGTNKISGDMITYDLQARRLTAGSGNSGSVKILIEPPRRAKEQDSTP